MCERHESHWSVIPQASSGEDEYLAFHHCYPSLWVVPSPDEYAYIQGLSMGNGKRADAYLVGPGLGLIASISSWSAGEVIGLSAFAELCLPPRQYHLLFGCAIFMVQSPFFKSAVVSVSQFTPPYVQNEP